MLLNRKTIGTVTFLIQAFRCRLKKDPMMTAIKMAYVYIETSTSISSNRIVYKLISCHSLYFLQQYMLCENEEMPRYPKKDVPMKLSAPTVLGHLKRKNCKT